MKDILLRYSLFILYWKIFSRDIYVYMLPNLAIYCIVISLGAYNSECIYLGNINVTVLVSKARPFYIYMYILYKYE